MIGSDVKVLRLRVWGAWLMLGALALGGVLPCACSGRSKADKLHAEGLILAKNRQFFKALEKFEQVLKIQPDRVDTLIQCAEIHLNTDKFDAAIQNAQKAIQLDPKNATGYLLIGQAHLALSRRGDPTSTPENPKLNQEELGKAVAIVEQLRKVAPDALEGMVLQARIDQANGRHDSATRLYKSVLERDPKNVTALLGLVDSSMARSDAKSAEAYARQAVNIEKNNTQALDDLALSLGLQNRFDEAYDLLATYVSSKNKQPEPTHFILAGRILLSQIDALDKGTSGTQGADEARARAMTRLGEVSSAMKGFFPSLPESYFYRAISFQLQKNITESIRNFEEACNKAPQDKRFRLALALAHMDNKNYSSARQELKTILREHPGDSDTQLRIAQCFALEGSYDEATEMMRELVVNQPTNNAYREALGKILVMSSEPDKVKEGMDLLSQVAGAGANAPGNKEMMQAQAALNEAEKRAAEGKGPEADAKYMEAENLFKVAAELQPKNFIPELRLSELAVRRGDLVSGFFHVRKATRIDAQFEALEARFYARLGQLESARDIYAKLVAANPGALGFELAVADLDVQLGRRDEALKQFDKLVREHPGDPRPFMHRALLIGRPEDVDSAVSFIKDYLKTDNQSMSTRVGMAQLLLKQNRPAEANDIMSELAGKLQTRIAALSPEMKAPLAEANALMASLKMKMALCALLNGEAPKASMFAAEALKCDPASLYGTLVSALVDIHNNKADQSIAALAKVEVKAEEKPLPWSLVHAMALVKTDKGQAIAAVKGQPGLNPRTMDLFTRLLEKQSSDKLSAAAGDLALLAVLTQFPELASSAAALADKLLKSLPDDPFVLSVRGDILEATGDLAGAAADYERLRKAAPDYAPVLLAQADLQMRLADAGQAQAKLDGTRKAVDAAAAACGQYLKMNPKDAVAQEKMGTILLTAGKTAEAIGYYRKAIEIDPERWTAYNNLAWNLAENQQLEEAAKMGAKALAGAPADGGVLDTAGWIEYLRGNMDRAVELLGQAALRLPNNPEVRHHLAQALARKGDKLGAAAELESIVLATPHYARIREVREMIRQLNPQSEILSGEGGSSPKPGGAGGQ